MKIYAGTFEYIYEDSEGKKQTGIFLMIDVFNDYADFINKAREEIKEKNDVEKMINFIPKTEVHMNLADVLKKATELKGEETKNELKEDVLLKDVGSLIKKFD